jgi:hypothetical protein
MMAAHNVAMLFYATYTAKGCFLQLPNYFILDSSSLLR